MDVLRKKQEDKNANIAEALELLEDKVRVLEKLLLRVRPRRVGIYEHRGLMFSEPLEILNQVMTGRYRRCPLVRGRLVSALRSEAHTSELQTLMRISYAVVCVKK